MARHVGSDRVGYHTYDGRFVTRKTIDLVIQELDAREQRRDRWQRMRTWGLLALLVAVLVIALVTLVWWRLAVPL